MISGLANSQVKTKIEDEFEPEYIPPEEEFYNDSLEEIGKKKLVKLNKEDYKDVELSPSRIWGILVIKLREKNYMTLHTACGEIRDLKQEGNKIIAITKEESLYNILTKDENYEKISFELKQIDDKITIEFVLKKVGKSKIISNLNTLKNLFGDTLEFNK